MTTIKDIIEKFQNKVGLNGLHAKPVEYMDYEDVTDEVKQLLSSSLTELLDSILKRLPPQFDEKNIYDDDFFKGYDAAIKKVINIINSHR